MKVKSIYQFLIRAVFLAFFLQLFLPFKIMAQYNENVLKAAYLEHITRFIEWPHNQSVRDSTNFIIGVYGDAEFYNILKEVLKTKKVKNHKLEIIQILDFNKIELCDLCYISGIPESNIEKIMTIANKNGVLIMTESKNFGDSGVHINFYLKDNKLKFEINKQSINSGKFKVSSLLLKNSKVI